jgi:cysteine desulfurase/selenocysteine lyase
MHMMPRSDFPLLMKHADLHYLDNASTAQKPQAMLDALNYFYTHENANTYRGIYELGELATERYELARATIAQFLNASHSSEIIFTRGTTDGINAIADGWARRMLQAGDEIVITQLEHHSNWLPWQRLAREIGIVVKVIPVFADGTLDMTAVQQLITSRTRLVATTWSSNAIGTIVPVAQLTAYAHAVGAKILIDAAQAVAHHKIDLQHLKPDFLVFSGHKIGGPTGIGVLYIARALHDQIEPYQVGGGMVLQIQPPPVWLPAPHKFEAGTPPIAQAIGLGAAINYFTSTIDYEQLRKHETALCARLMSRLEMQPSIRILSPRAALTASGHLVTFVINGIHAHDAAAYLGRHTICVRAGHFCAQPIAHALGYIAAVRASFFGYTTAVDIDVLADGIDRLLAALR